jgi:hypothetical protein
MKFFKLITCFLFVMLNETPNYVPNEETAIKIAEAVWLPIYGEDIYNKPQLAQASACALKKLWDDKQKTVKLQKDNKRFKVEFMQNNYKGTSGRLRQIWGGEQSKYLI